jgi:hypothetical protein
MFGLTALQSIVKPETTLDKIEFLIDHIFTDAHVQTTIIALAALAALVLLRVFKNFFRDSKYRFIYRMPEVLIVVCVSTCAFFVFSAQKHILT